MHIIITSMIFWLWLDSGDKMNKIKKYIWLIVIIIILIILVVVLLCSIHKYDIFWTKIYNDNDFHYNLITFNSVIAGFLFSGISILISLISNNSVKRLWDCGYLDCLYKSGEISIFMSIGSIIMSFITVMKFNFISDCSNLKHCWTIIEIVLAIGSLSLFSFCVKELMFSIKVIRHENKLK